MDSSTSSSNWLAELRALVNDAFSTDELHGLCLDLHLRYDEIPGEGEVRKVVELIQIMVRDNRIVEFIEHCQSLKPRRNWQPLLEAANQEPLAFRSAPEDAVPFSDPVTAVPGRAPVSTPDASKKPSLQKKWLIIGGVAAAVLIFLIMILIDADSDEFNDPVLFEKIESLVANPSLEADLVVTEGLPGWNSQQAVYADSSMLMGSQVNVLRDKTFGARQGIQLDFELSQVNNDPADPSLTFSLQNARDRAEATRTVSLLVMTQLDGVVLEAGQSSPPTKFVRNMSVLPNETYTVVLGLDENGRFIASVYYLFDVEQDAIFTFDLPEDWAQETWYFNVHTGSNTTATLFSGREFSFDEVKN